MTDIEGVVFSTISDESVIILTPDKQCVYDSMVDMFAPGKYNVTVPITFYVEEFDVFEDFYAVRDKVAAMLADLLAKMCTFLDGRYFGEDGYNEILLNTAISFTMNVDVTDGVVYDRIHSSFDGVR